jgi:hypothetical protein
MEERTRNRVLERGVLELREALEKAWHVSNLGEDYFDLRDQNGLTDTEAQVVLLGYAGAALEHEVVHDYLTQALRRARALEAALY